MKSNKPKPKKQQEGINVKEDIKREPGQISFNEALKKASKPLKK
ncbi:hypothetical protein GCM10028803_45670 [Larkinella knui]|nr:hypothetical protein [Larkinella knui]